MDFEYQDRFHELTFKMLPSEYWRRQCKATFQFDRIGTKLVEDMGVETAKGGLGLPASGRHLAGLDKVHQSTSMSSSANCRPTSCTRSLARTRASCTA
jgi:hypothetical protein